MCGSAQDIHTTRSPTTLTWRSSWSVRRRADVALGELYLQCSTFSKRGAICRLFELLGSEFDEKLLREVGLDAYVTVRVLR